MRITEDEVRYVAELANLDLTGDETRKMAVELDKILTHIERLSELDTSGVEPMRQAVIAGGEAALRADEPRPVLGESEALANAPEAGAGHFKVPRVIER